MTLAIDHLAVSAATLEDGAAWVEMLAEPEETRAQDSRSFTATAATTFNAMAAAPGDVVDMSTTSRYAGVLDGAPLGVKDIDMPASPSRVWQAIQSAK